MNERFYVYKANGLFVSSGSVAKVGMKFLIHPTGLPIAIVLFLEFYGEILNSANAPKLHIG